MSLNLAAQDIAVLETRTEGWVAGLQLAALSMQGRKDISGFIRSFAGDDRYIADYLVEEVLQRQPDHMSGSFLLLTSILDRLNGSFVRCSDWPERWQKDAGSPGKRQPFCCFAG